MPLFVSHRSALEYWRQTSPQIIAKLVRSSATPGRLPADTSHIDLSAVAHLSLPVHVTVSSPEHRRSSKLLVCHASSCPPSRMSYFHVGKNVFVASPELCFLQIAAEETDHVKLALLGLELCGGYVLRPYHPLGFEARDPLTRRKQIAALVDKMNGCAGTKRARSVLRWVADGSASPMESALVLLICLPPRMGGYGLELPALNYRLVPTCQQRPIVDRTHYICDLYWPDAKLDVEYDSRQWHSSYEKSILDAHRRDALLAMGVTVETISLLHIKDPVQMDRKVRQIARILKHRPTCFKEQHELQRRMLRAKLFHHGKQE